MHQSQGKKKDDFWSCSVLVKINLQLTLSYLLWMLMIDLSTWFINFSKLFFYYYFSLFSLAFFSDFLYNYAFHIFCSDLFYHFVSFVSIKCSNILLFFLFISLEVINELLLLQSFSLLQIIQLRYVYLVRTQNIDYYSFTRFYFCLSCMIKHIRCSLSELLQRYPQSYLIWVKLFLQQDDLKDPVCMIIPEISCVNNPSTIALIFEEQLGSI